MENIRSFRTGRIIFREGEALGNVYLVNKGKVKLVKNYGPNQTTLGYIEENGVFGEMALLDNQPRSATAIAVEDTECRVLDHDELLTRLQNTDPFIRGIICIMSERLRSTTESFADTKQKLNKMKAKMSSADS